MAYTLEALPVRPPSADGADTDPLQDGAWTEEPVQGAYTRIGWWAEYKPMTRYPGSMESLPSSTHALEAKPLEDVPTYTGLADGSYTADGTYTADGGS